MYKLEEIRRNYAGIQHVSNNILGASLLRFYIEYVNSVACSRTHLIQDLKVFAELRCAAVQSYQTGGCVLIFLQFL